MKKILFLSILGMINIGFGAERFYPDPELNDKPSEEITNYLERICKELILLNSNQTIIIDQLSAIKKLTDEYKIEIWEDLQPILD